MVDERAEVWVQLLGYDQLAGTVFAHRRGRTESATFSYADSYLATPLAYPLDPQLPLSSGSFTTVATALFGAFSDSAPDRWGRTLIERAERKRAKAEQNARRSFGELDYTLNVRDDLRQGALRFRRPGDDEWLSPAASGIPHLVSLPTLLTAVDVVGTDGADPDNDALRLLVGAGSSIGGARPKAAVINGRGELCIAKFPRAGSDEWDVMAWEKLALTLAEAAGIQTPTSELMTVSGRSVLVLGRFDRHGDTRIGYASAMTLLEARDGEQRSYVEIAELIEQFASLPTAQLAELWRRMVFSMLISTTDDHLRNHGFLREDSSNSWNLAPAFDLNPNPEPGNKQLSTAVVDNDFDIDVESARAVAGLFRLSLAQAKTIEAEVRQSVARWAVEAARMQIRHSEIDLMAGAFEGA